MLKIEIRREKRKSISLQIVAPDKLLVKAPLFSPESQIWKFVNKRQNWIDKQNAIVKNRRDFFALNKVLFLGKVYILKAEISDKNTISKSDSTITIHHKESQNPKSILHKWYQNNALRVFTKLADIYCQKMNVTYKKLKLSSAKTRWGSCSSLSNINLNWNLIKAPEKIIAYVVAHELTHLTYPHHGKFFWNNLEVFYPEYKEAKKWLRENGGYLLY